MLAAAAEKREKAAAKPSFWVQYEGRGRWHGWGGQNMGIINQIKRSWGGTSGRDRPADPMNFFHFNFN